MRQASFLVPALLLLLILPALPAAAASSYDDVVDITFPVAGDSSFIRDYDHDRSGGRAHRATDVMAPYGAKVHAAVGGTVSWITGTDGNPPSYGYMLSIRGDDGRKYSYVHLGRQDGPASEAYAPGIADGVRVERGQHIGYNGCSGNASCAGTHLHFEIHDASITDPYGGNRMDPYDSLVAAEQRGDVPGARGRIPVMGDWDGDGQPTPGTFHAGTWSLYDSYEATAPYWTMTYGRAGDTPVVGDWDGDGTDTLGVVRGNRFILRNVYRSGADDIVLDYGRNSDTPVVGDWDGNGTTTLGVVRGNRFILRNVYRSGADDIVLDYGRNSDTPVVGDWDGNGTTTLGVVRGNRFILRNVYRSGADDVVMDYGRDSDTPIVGDWDGNGTTTLGVVRGSMWILRNVYRSGADDIVFEPR